MNRGKRLISTSLSNKKRKTKTTYTSGTETVDVENTKVTIARPEVKLERIMTDHQDGRHISSNHQE